MHAQQLAGMFDLAGGEGRAAAKLHASRPFLVRSMIGLRTTDTRLFNALVHRSPLLEKPW